MILIVLTLFLIKHSTAIEINSHALYSLNQFRNNLFCTNDEHCAPSTCENNTCVTSGSCTTDNDCMIMQSCINGVCKNQFGVVRFKEEGEPCGTSIVDDSFLLNQEYLTRRAFPSSHQTESGFIGIPKQLDKCKEGLVCDNGKCVDLFVKERITGPGGKCLSNEESGIISCGSTDFFCDMSDAVGQFQPGVAIDKDVEGLCASTIKRTGADCGWIPTCFNTGDVCDPLSKTCVVNAGVETGTFCNVNADCLVGVKCINNVCTSDTEFTNLKVTSIVKSSDIFGPIGVNGEVQLNICDDVSQRIGSTCVKFNKVIIRRNEKCDMEDKRCPNGLFCDGNDKCVEIGNPKGPLIAMFALSCINVVLIYFSVIIYNNTTYKVEAIDTQEYF